MDDHVATVVARALSAGFVIIGVSHVVAARAWARLFADASKARSGGLIIGAITLPIGLLIAAGHNVWRAEPAVIVTIAGWLMALKGVVYLLFPQAFHRIVDDDEDRMILKLRVVGCAMALLGAFVAWDVFQ